MSAVVFLDIDGVMSPIHEDSIAWTDWEPMPYGAYSLLLSRSMAARILALPARIVWLTTWGALANSEVGVFLGWPPHEIIELDPTITSSEAKALGLQKALISNEDDSIVVVDDDPDVRESARRLLVGRRHLLIGPDPSTALTPSELDEIDVFLRSRGPAPGDP